VWRSLLAVAVGGVLGTAARWGVDVLLPHVTPGSLAVSTVVVNVVGSFVLGLLVASLWTRARVPMWLKAGVGTGILGSFTTFSAVALNVVASAVEANVLATIGALVLSTVLGLLAAWGGLALGARLAGQRVGQPTAIPDGGVDL
jgi:CrcB protein